MSDIKKCHLKDTIQCNNDTVTIEKDIEDIYSLEVNTKYISSNVLKIYVISRVRSTSEIADIFNTRDEIFWYLPKKSKFSFYFLFCLGGKLNFFQSHSSLILLGSVRLVGIILGANCVRNWLKLSFY